MRLQISIVLLTEALFYTRILVTDGYDLINKRRAVQQQLYLQLIVSAPKTVSLAANEATIINIRASSLSLTNRKRKC